MNSAAEHSNSERTAPWAALVLVGTPIGNTADASARMQEEIAHADFIAAEDTRRFMGLASRLNLSYKGKLFSLFDHNEQAKAGDIADHIAAGCRVVLLTDAGMPAVSDPGYHVVKEVAKRGLPVTSAPGPSAVFTALAISGLPSNRFTFEGFVPRKAGERSRVLAELAEEKRTMVFFESPHRIIQTLEAFREHFGAERDMVLCRELTKTYEEVIRANVGDLLTQSKQRGSYKGELTLVVAGACGQEGVLRSPAELAAQVSEHVAKGARAKEAAAQVAKKYRLKTREVYEIYLHRNSVDSV